VTQSTAGYAGEAEALLERYERRDPEAVLSALLPWLPPAPARILDVGCGTGRDAAYLAGLGHEVVAVEPVEAMRRGALRLHGEARVRWGDDALPGLPRTVAAGGRFDLILANAVWMHLDAGERRMAMATVASLLVPGGRLYVSLRHGPVPEGRRMFEVTGEETVALGARHGLVRRFEDRQASVQPENVARSIEWTVLVLELRAES